MIIKAMSFNLRLQTEHDGINEFSKRYPRAFEVVKNESPDVIGFQEVTDYMRSVIEENLTDYTFVGCGRDSDYHGECMLIGYKKDFILVGLENVWYSNTPSIAGSRYVDIDQSGCPRMYTTALLKHNDVKKPFRFINTHFDHSGEIARYLEALQLTNAIKSYPECFILTGDFNATPESREMIQITRAFDNRPVIDCTSDIGPTFHSYFNLSPKERVKIDYIFTDMKCKGAYAIPDPCIDGLCYSDHNAVCALIELE